ncbi:MAG: NAD(P)/FAD-dependent oxidoreductase [Deltaproteobacteria bacterium]|nr:NAD(P)/FAD-dependent oxidoreductase [Deltaproteobacteria bacterium]
MRFVVIGAGMSGILAAIRLREAGYDDVVVYEKADRPGGTWRENTYPGLSCDVPSHFYSYSFALNPDWSRRYSPGAEIQAYFTGVAKRYGVTDRTRFGKEIVRCAFEDGRWHLTANDGATDVADVVIAATGVLHHPKMPEIEGLETFAGAAFHSARWDHSVPIDGRRVGVVGTGSSAVQIVTAITDRVGQLVLFQRTPQWIMPAQNPAYGDEEKASFRAHPEAMEEIRRATAQQFCDGFANIVGETDSPILQAMHDMCVAHLESSVHDPELREKLRPSYRAACKRLVIADGFYEAIQRPNARLVTDGVARVEPAGVRTKDGTLYPLDVLVLATGFQVDWFVRPMQVTGRGGVRLDDLWAHGATAYLSMTVPGFPNFFMLNGPNGPVGNFSLIEVAELQFDYVLKLVDELRRGACRELAPSAEAMARFDAERREAAKKTIWNTGCRSWYLDETGLPTAWPFTFDRFRNEMAAPRLEDYERR